MPNMARGALVGGIAAFGTYLWSRSRMWTALLALLSICVIAILIDQRSATVLERWTIWSETFPALTFKGYGVGSYYFLYPFLTGAFDTTLARPEHPHNELMEIWFELGIIGTFIYVCLVAAAFRSADSVSRCILVAFVTIGMFAFPSHVPFTAFLGAVILGHAVRLGQPIWIGNEHSGPGIRPWYERGFAHKIPD